jgi:uncharacterized protein
MNRERKKSTYSVSIYFKKFYDHFENIIARIPLLSVAIKGWQLATIAFAADLKGYRRKQEWKSFYYALINPIIASKWFKILESPDFIQVATQRQRIYIKPFRAYMSIRWTIKQKIKVILDTYRFIMSKGDAFKQVINQNITTEIARFKLNNSIEGCLTLGFDDRYRKEGELVFSFECNQLGGVIVAAAFSFEEIEVGKWITRISCIQGHKLKTENSSKITQKLMNGLRPKSLIIFAIQEFSRQLGFVAVYGAGDAIQAYRRKHLVHLPWRHAINFDYNATWTESGGRLLSNGWYILP